MKKLLFDNHTLNVLKNGIEEPRYKEIRKIGENEVVLEAVKLLLDCKKAYYIGLIPSNQADIDKFERKTDFDIHFLSWAKVHEFCKVHKLEKVLAIFKYNKGQIYQYED
ncbi:hypothetical protein CLU81_1220 [Flavobacterium sp. 9]|uniref:hypothetical protein n=1 Tax=Flavobacterium sp. 9 TaxID=2035198 RepID=UPI000C1A0446|nr:hypothetical protein [Flavobacterium sp. 9]PIF30771.1 hypothetical protein CLU81_1220 [Flavobacterium sp. 9]